MILMNKFTGTFFGLLLTVTFGYAQSIEELQKSYSGEILYKADEATLYFLTSGSIYFNKPDTCFNYYWDVPEEIRTIVIEKNTNVTGAIHTYSDCTIKGMDRKTSVIYGTPEQSWANNRNLKAYEYSHILNHNGILWMQDLTMENPYSFFVRGFRQPVHIANCNFYDYRGGHHNHSDGVSGGDGSTIDNCYFATGDDAIKVYSNMTITNTTIEMVDNCVPIQLGWGSYSNGAVGNFKNLTIIGNSGRHSSDNAVISGREGTYDVTINIDGCTIKNPNAVMVSLWDSTMTLRGEIKNADIEVGAYSKRRTAGIDSLTICGAKTKLSRYICK